MKFLLRVLLAVGFICAAGVAGAGVKFPKEKDFRQFRNVCAGGDVQEIQHRVDQVLRDWKSDREAHVNIESARRNLGAVMEKVTPDASGNALYESYVSCVRDLIEKFLTRMNAPRARVIPGEGVDGFLTLGVTYGSIRSAQGPVLTNDNRTIGLARIGWWFNEHVALGFEGSYWQAKSYVVEVGGSRVQSTQPLRHVASTVALPLYIHFGRRFPLVLYGGVGQGWESNDQIEVSQAGTLLSRTTTKDSGLAIVVGAGFEFSLSPNTSISVLARGIRTTIDSPSTSTSSAIVSRPERDILSFGVALTFH